jgi:hypothetical protein
MLYDQRCFFEQHEYEAAPWRAARCTFNTTHLDAYLRVIPSSELQRDHGDRNALCAMWASLCVVGNDDADEAPEMAVWARVTGSRPRILGNCELCHPRKNKEYQLTGWRAI